MSLRGLARDSDQPDAAFRAWAAAAGGTLEWERAPDGEEALTVTGPDGGARSLLSLSVDVDAAPDAALPLAALVTFAGGTSRLSGVARLREKESDRLAAALDLRPLLGSVRAPTLVLSGAEDIAAPPSVGACTARTIPGARLTVIAAASHFAHYEKPGPITNALLSHFTSESQSLESS